MKARFTTDDEIIQAIKQGGTQRQLAIRHIYKDEAFSQKVIQFVQANTGNYQDGQDMFHEGIIVLDRNIRNDKFRGESSLKGYLYSTCRFLWMNQIRKKSKVSLTEDQQVMDSNDLESPEVIALKDEKKMLLSKILEQLGDRCKKVLELWRLSYSMEEIASQVGLSSAAMATKTKYRCHKQLIQFLNEHPQLMDLLKA